MTDQMIPADKVREILANRDLRATEMIAEIESILPHPPLPTLADMTEVARRECRLMQADVNGMKGRRVITYPGDGGETTQIMLPNGMVVDIYPENVTPRPDLPRMEWPGDEPEAAPEPAPAPALPDGWRLADHEKHGRVIVTRTEPDRNGYAYCVVTSDRDGTGFDWHYCDPDELTYIDQEAEETIPVKVGDVIDSADDPRLDALPDESILLDSDNDAVIKRGGDWKGAGYIPIASEGDNLGPWKVDYIPNGADQ